MDFYNNLRNAIRARKKRERNFADFWIVSPATITTEGGTTTFDEAGASYTWIFLHNHPSGKMAVLNPTAITEDGTPVLAARNPKSPHRWSIIGLDTSRVRGGTQAASRYAVGLHGPNHRMVNEFDIGPDPVEIFQAALMPLKTVGDGATLVVRTYPYIYTAAYKRYSYGGVDTDLTSYVPGAGLTRKVLLYLDRDTNTLNVEAGATVLDGGALPAPEPIPPAGINAELSALVNLTNGQTAITTAGGILDCRDVLKDRDTNIGTLPVATAPGQVLIADEALNWISVTPIIDEEGYWMSGDNDELVWE